MALTPVFLFAVPRSGSTLLQRVLATYDGVTTAAEPWILLPSLLALKERPPLTDAWHQLVGSAIRDFMAELPRGEDDYLRAVHDFCLELYAQAGEPGARLFVDKTPPYHHVCQEIIRAFPDARFVFLWRNPLSVVASTVETFSDGRWDVQRHRGDLFDGVANLTAAYRRYADRAVAVRYEDLVDGGEEPWRRLTGYLGLEFDPASLERFAGVRFAGSMGDPTGTVRYTRLAGDAVQKWRSTVANPVRKEWCRRYLLWIGAERLALMGYDLDALLAELDDVPAGSDHVRDDVREVALSMLREAVKARMGDDGLMRTWPRLLRARPA